MVKELYQNILKKENIRNNLISLKNILKHRDNLEKLKEYPDFSVETFLSLLSHDEPKVRKNAAQILGILKIQESFDPLFQAYQTEIQMYNRSAYLKAMSQLAYDNQLNEFEKQLQFLTESPIKEEEKKHVREEIFLLQQMIQKVKRENYHDFTGYNETFEIILTTNPLYREVTAKQLNGDKVWLTPLGIKTITNRMDDILKIRTFDEILFPITCNQELTNSPEQIASVLSTDSNLFKILKQSFSSDYTYKYRLGIISQMKLDKRSAFIKKCTFALETNTNRQLVNSASDYEIEIRLYHKKDDTFFPVLKICVLKDIRFSYRKNVTSSSLRVQTAALIAELCSPYYKEYAQVLDPFCGTGSILIERYKKKKTKTLYGIDIHREALSGAKENADFANVIIHPVNRDFFTFQHEYLFDEIVTNMPYRDRKSREEQDRLYYKFFTKARQVLKSNGMIFMYTDEPNIVKKYLRLKKEYVLKQEYCLNAKEKRYLFIIGQRRQA